MFLDGVFDRTKDGIRFFEYQGFTHEAIQDLYRRHIPKYLFRLTKS